MKLTPKQDKFCRNIVEGMDYTNAYLNAYNTTKRHTGAQEGLKLIKRDDITERINELMKPVNNYVSNNAISERKQIKNILWNRLQLAIDNQDDNLILKYSDMINKMNSEYVNVTQNISETVNEIAELDTETLKKLTVVK